MTEEYQLSQDDLFEPETEETEEPEETEWPEEPITGNKVLDVKIKYNYTPDEIEILKYNPLGEGLSWSEKLKNKDLNDFILWRRKKRS